MFVIWNSTLFRKSLARDYKHSKPSWFLQALNQTQIPTSHICLNLHNNFPVWKNASWPGTIQKVDQSSEISSVSEHKSSTMPFWVRRQENHIEPQALHSCPRIIHITPETEVMSWESTWYSPVVQFTWTEIQGTN